MRRASALDFFAAAALIAALAVALAVARAFASSPSSRSVERFESAEEQEQEQQGRATKVVATYSATDGAVGRVEVLDASDGGAGRCLAINGAVQFCEDDEHRYHEMLVDFACEFLPEPKQPKRVLLIRGGDGMALRELLRRRGEALERVTVVEDDERMLEACESHLQVVDLRRGGDARVRWIFGPPAAAVSRMSKAGGDDRHLHRVDLVLLDLKPRPGPSPVTPQMCGDLGLLLAPRGVVACSGTPSDRANLRAAFPHSLAYAFEKEDGRSGGGEVRMELFARSDLAALRPAADADADADAAEEEQEGGEGARATRFFDPRKLWSYVPWFA